MPQLEQAKLSNTSDIVDWDAVGEQPSGGGRRIPQPGTYEFKMPDTLKDCWTEAKDGERGKRVGLLVDLLITNTAPNNTEYGNETRSYLISGFERNRARKGEPERWVSDLQFFYRDGLKGQEKPSSFLALCKLIEKEGAGRRFTADVEWRTYCNKDKVRWVYSEETSGLVEDPDKTKGCGKGMYQRELATFLKGPDGAWVGERVTCPCGANLRVQDGLSRFRGPVSTGGK